MFFVILVVIVVGSCIFSSIQANEERTRRNQKAEERRKHLQEKEAEQKRIYELEIQSLVDKFGSCSACVSLRSNLTITSDLFIFEDSRMIVLYGNEYKFSDILGFSLVDDATSETITTSTGDAKTSTGSMIGRAVVGGVLTGGLGAVAGAATAKKNIATNATSQTTTTHKYTVYVNVNSLSNPTVTIRIGDDSQKAYKLANLFNVIIAREKQGNLNIQ